MEKYLIVGLGNIGDKYQHTRHNIGFDVVEHLAKSKEAQWTPCRFGTMVETTHKGRKLILLKPDTYMNLSGKAIKYWMDKERISLDRIMVVTDDLNLPFGTIRIKPKGSDGGHNGLKSVQVELNTTVYPRLRFGIGNAFEQAKQVDFVLGQWTAEEASILTTRLNDVQSALLSFVFNGLNPSMNQWNGSPK